MTMLGSKQHTVSDNKRWEIDYERYLRPRNTTIANAAVLSSSSTCTVANMQVLGPRIIFYVTGGMLGEVCTVTITMYDSAGNKKQDTLTFTVVAP